MKLRPCPFCSYPDVHLSEPHPTDPPEVCDTVRVVCMDCLCRGPTIYLDELPGRPHRYRPATDADRFKARRLWGLIYTDEEKEAVDGLLERVEYRPLWKGFCRGFMTGAEERGLRALTALGLLRALHDAGIPMSDFADPEFMGEQVRIWCEGDEAARLDIIAFLESGGPEKLRQSSLKDKEGIPTADELEGHLNVDEQDSPED